MEVLTIPSGLDARGRGRVHGEHFRARIHEIAQLRLELALSQGKFASSMEVVETARLHLPVLEGFDAPLHAELLGIAEGADLDPAKLVVLNHYTDLKDVDPKRLMAFGRSLGGAVVLQLAAKNPGVLVGVVVEPSGLES